MNTDEVEPLDFRSAVDPKAFRIATQAYITSLAGSGIEVNAIFSVKAYLEDRQQPDLFPSVMMRIRALLILLQEGGLEAPWSVMQDEETVGIHLAAFEVAATLPLSATHTFDTTKFRAAFELTVEEWERDHNDQKN